VALVATLAIEPDAAEAAEAFVAVCRLSNVGVDPIDINVAAFASPSLALEIHDAAGGPVHLPPPPVPPAEPPIERLLTGEDRVETFPGFLPSWTEPGEYRARCRYVFGPGEPTVSDWVQFRLRR
jgi:hypothetical protein